MIETGCPWKLFVACVSPHDYCCAGDVTVPLCDQVINMEPSFKSAGPQPKDGPMDTAEFRSDEGTVADVLVTASTAIHLIKQETGNKMMVQPSLCAVRAVPGSGFGPVAAHAREHGPARASAGGGDHGPLRGRAVALALRRTSRGGTPESSALAVRGIYFAWTDARRAGRRRREAHGHEAPGTRPLPEALNLAASPHAELDAIGLSGRGAMGTTHWHRHPPVHHLIRPSSHGRAREFPLKLDGVM